ncbi:hypothetical protein G7062_10520 [Erysipelothrix sp. HDW6C]|uniref:helicase HerA domain-containing protein n=1 Tax=Erysipelothrix sp. HDW6C TaxID=2714930 RepID=UPI0014089310|nr:DUF87 domain-containing protein [Erysipelothrix sp. HDW6C]QIK70710.1 hypothetical protein G7062_10520 [Erysipelothrix sp. HDW6C]
MIFRKKNTATSQKITRHNAQTLKRIVSQSGISWHELYYVNENRYFTCFQIMEFPETSQNDMLKTLNKRDDAFVTIDFSHVSAKEFNDQYESTLNKAERKKTDSKSFTAFRNAKKEQDAINDFNAYIDYTKQTVKTFSLRVFVFGKTFDELQRSSDEITNDFARLKLGGYIQTNNLAEDYQSITMLSNPIKQEVSSATLADFTMYNNVNVTDYHAAILGATATGVYAPNNYLFLNNSYNLVYIGGMGSGKSALAKKNEKNHLIKGNHTLHLLDVHNEYPPFCEAMDIPVVSFSENQNINICQIFSTTKSDGSGELTENDIQTRVSSIQETFKSFTGLTSETTYITLGEYLRKQFDGYIGKDFRTLKHSDWFTLGEIRTSVIEDLESLKDSDSAVKRNKANDLYEIERGLTDMCDNYGYIFDRITNIDFDLNKSICFDISFLSNNDDKRVLSSYLTVISNYLMQAVYLNLQKNLTMERKLKSKLNAKTHKEPYFTHRVLIDEFMKYAHDLSFLNAMEVMIKYMRKAYSGLAIIVHTTTETQKALTEHGEAIKNIFDLCTTKYIGRTGENSAKLLPTLLSGVTENDANATVNMRKNEKTGVRRFLVRDDQGRKLFFSSIITEREQAYFGGGV